MNKTNAREHIHAESVVWQYRKVKPNKIHTTVSKHSVGIWPICLIARTISSKCSKKKSKGKTNLLETSLKNRSSWKRVSPKSKLYSYLMTMIWRRKLGLRRSRMTRFLVIFTLEAILTSPPAKLALTPTENSRKTMKSFKKPSRKRLSRIFLRLMRSGENCIDKLFIILKSWNRSSFLQLLNGTSGRKPRTSEFRLESLMVASLFAGLRVRSIIQRMNFSPS